MYVAKRIVFFVVLAVLIAAGGCTNNSDQGVPLASAKVSVGYLSNRMLTAATTGDVATITVDVYNGSTLIVGGVSLSYNSGLWTGTINNLPIGPQLTFTGHACNNTAVEIFTGSTHYTMTGAHDQVPILMAPVSSGGVQQFPKIVNINQPTEIVTAGTASVGVDVTGGADETYSYVFTAATDGGTFNPASGNITLTGTAGIVLSDYTAPGNIGTYDHSITVANSQGNSITTMFSIKVISAGTGTSGIGIEFAPVILTVNGQRNGSDVTFTATVSDDGPAGELRYLWSFDGGLAFADATTNPAVLQGYNETVAGTLTLTVTDHNGTGSSTVRSVALIAGQFPGDPIIPPPPPPPAGGDCIDCHSMALVKTYGSGGAIRQVVGPGGDFMFPFAGSRHLFGATTIVRWDCVVCHLEGSIVDGGPSAFHHGASDLTGSVNLRDVDTTDETGASGWTINNRSWSTTDYAKLDAFCLSCHDANGASAVYVNATNDGVGTGNRSLTPFNTTDVNASGNMGGSTNLPNTPRMRVVNIKDKFYAGTNGPGATYNGNPSQHAVLGRRYSVANANWGTSWANVMLKKTGQNLQATRETSLLSCADCHVLDAGAGGNAHGGRNAYNMWATTLVSECWRCHKSTTYFDGAGPGTRMNHNIDGSWNGSEGSYGFGNNLSMVNCLLCHSSWNGTTTISRMNSGLGGIHGSWTSTAWMSTSGASKSAQRFFPGSYFQVGWGSDGGWSQQGATVSCYFWSRANSSASSCTSHTNTVPGTRSNTTNYIRPTKY
jgi:hypothetical protein